MDVLYVVLLSVGFVLGFLTSTLTRKLKTRYDGTIEVSASDTSQIYRLEIDTPPDKLKSQNRVLFKVERMPNS